MAAMRAVLEPLLWAFFLMMGLLPLTDTVEWLLLRACLPQPGSGGCSLCNGHRPGSSRDPGETEMGPFSPKGGTRHTPDGEFQLVTEDLDDDVASGDGTVHDEGCNVRKPARTIAVLIVIGGFISLISLFFVMIYESVAHMHDSFPDYIQGAKRISNDTEAVISLISKQASPKMVQDMTDKVVGSLGDIVSLLVSATVGNLSSTLVSMLMIFLYMIFWLCHPVYVQESVAVLFKRYIMLKTLASAGYAFCVWVLLHTLGINLAVVFGLITFLFNFVPEVGPFLAAMLPLPVILFDGRLSNPWLVLGIALGGTLLLKFLFGNIVEVILIESQQDMKMHPVIILFLMAFFGWIWGATGMVLSVPLMAAAKGSMYMLPPTYRNPLLMILEGDKKAPARYDAWYQNRHVVQEPVGSQPIRHLDHEPY
eukprot:CAMPEP_0172827800 /NCGR_PEP_ID=MMETSP1075-20121228/20372_1 /TAXON_ID=2916 /ORGANISM="Ceratium fusus, Strain PA161109" /LENGTH=422 /DNA_ID=CAMNT_0013669675 /DNA_START=109 /DNA_END=1377 /DNA_ORIENTATION=+